ncbi:MAG: hypothetical protein KDD44_12080, partial [Bdellovibrionales bacterium]|nr:hypothetical protein [Bdellovibrionales bacterium]
MFAHVKRSTPLLLLLYVLVFAGYVYWSKAYFFENLQYTYDLLNSVQISTSLVQERPIFHYPNAGAASYTHNYVLLLALGPLVQRYGAYALFATLSLFILLSGVAAVRLICEEPQERKQFRLGVVVALMFFGPMAYWIYDDSPNGFNIEILYLPLALLFAVA